jgi:hypothetical protein
MSKRYDELGDDEPTVIDGAPLAESENDTPELQDHCVECGAVCFTDNAATVSFPDDRCLRAWDGHWHWCAKLRKSVTYVPR